MSMLFKLLSKFNPISAKSKLEPMRFNAYEFKFYNSYNDRMGIPNIAARKSRLLFLSHLSDEEITSWLISGHIKVVGSVTEKKYSIHNHNISYNIDGNYLAQYGNHHLEQYCIMPSGLPIPLHDIWLAQYLIIKYHEDKFLKVANIL